MEKKVYLGGPVAGLEYDSVVGWRDKAIEYLREFDIKGVTPFRYKEHLNQANIVMGLTDNNPITTRKGVVVRDRWDVLNCDVFLANLLNAKEISKGTLIEYGWADAFRKPIITIIEREGNVHEHIFVQEITGFRVETLEEGLYVTRAILDY